MKPLSINRFKIPYAFQIIMALLLGCLAGFLFKERAASLGEVGVYIIKILKFLATPLVFFVVVNALCKTEVSLKSGIRLLGYSLRNALVAIFISISLAHLIPVGNYINLKGLSEAISGGAGNTKPHLAPPLSFVGFLKGLIPRNPVDFLSGANLITVVLLALICGALLRSFRNLRIESFVGKAQEVSTTLLGYVVKIVPIAVFTIVAKVVGTTGLKYFSVLGLFVVIVSSGIFIHVFVYYSLVLKLALKRSPKEFFKSASAPLFTALGTGSSLATLPVTLPTLKNMNVSTASASLAACVGTNLNHDGILLYEATAALFIAQVQSIPLSVTQQIHISLVSLVAAIGIAGIPDAGLISLSLVLGAVGLPLTAVPFLLPVDWLIGRLRAFTNVASDMIVACLLDRHLEG
jgi:Na+/H+-dicarboxylate symporter